MQMVAGAHGPRPVLGQPVTGHVYIPASVAAGVQLPASRYCGEVQGPRGDVNIGDLLCDSLERGQGAPELLARRHVLGGELKRRRDRSVGDAASARHG